MDNQVLFLALTMAHASTGGTPADPNTFGYLISVQYRQDPHPPSSFCLAAQVAPRMLFTAAHCLADWPDSGKPLYVAKKLDAGDLKVLHVKDFVSHPSYGTKPPSFSTDPYDISILRTLSEYSEGQLTYKGDFDPYAHIDQQPRKEIVVNDFGFNREVGEIYTGRTLVMAKEKCLEQLDDLIQHELVHLSGDEAKMLLGIVLQFETSPKSIFCSFIKKTDPFQHERGDSGAPLVFEVDGKSLLAGVLTAIVPIPSSQQYSMITLYNNIANGKDFLQGCIAPSANGGSSFAAERSARSTSDSCVYKRMRIPNIALLFQLLF